MTKKLQFMLRPEPGENIDDFKKRVNKAAKDAQTKAKSKSTDEEYIVYIDDNFHFMDESERYKQGTYATYDEAVSISKKIVDEFLLDNADKEDDAGSLLRTYQDYGEDPFIQTPKGANHPHFSAWNYAEKRCNEIMKNKKKEK